MTQCDSQLVVSSTSQHSFHQKSSTDCKETFSIS